MEIHPPAYEEEILEEPTLFDNLENEEYNKLVREGTQTDFAPVMNFVVICAFFVYSYYNFHLSLVP